MSTADIPADSTWTLRGKIYLWRYEAGSSRAYAGWHLTLDPAAAESVAELLRRIRQAEKLRKRTLPLTQPTPAILGVPNNRRAKAIGALAWKLLYDPSADPDLWRLEGRENTAELEMGSRAFGELINGVDAIRAGEGDFSIGDPKLWFWWYPR
jgi:hypothetical protein